MKNFKRDNLYFSLCGLNCGLCTMRLGGHCPGCGQGTHHSCAIAKCSIAHNNVQYCFLCSEFPCAKYENIDRYDSFITHRNQLADIEKAKIIGMEAYNKEQIEKIEALHYLLEYYNAGRQKTFFSLAVNLLDIQDVRDIVENLASHRDVSSLSIKEKAAYAMNLFQAVADKKDIPLKLNKKPSSK